MTDLNTSIRRGQLKPIQYDDLDATNAAVDNYVASYDQATGKFTWVNKLGSGDIDDFTIKYVNNQLKVADRIELNTMLNAFRIAINGSLSQFNMVDGITDEFEDETGVDTASSTNEDYDSTNDLYKPTTVAALELDYMEYANDGAAQAAYVTSAAPGEVIDQQSGGTSGRTFGHNYAGSPRWLAQSFILSGAKTVTAVEIWQKTVTGSPTGNWTFRIETDSAGEPSGTLAHANASVVVAPPGVEQAAKGTFASSFALSASTTYWVVAQCDYQDSGDYWDIAYSGANPYASGMVATTTDGGANWTLDTGDDLYFKVYVEGGAPDLQSYSEASIKNQGSYSLKAVAAITDSLNDTLTKSGLSIDLSGKDELKIDFYASRTGTNLQLKIHDSGGTTSTKNIVISSADTWETTTWDISGIADADKDVIDQIIIEVTNADSANTFYVDNFYSPALTNNMTLINNAETADAQPDNARIVLYEEDVDSITLNTDLKAYVTRDGGTTYSQVTLADEGDYETGKQILTGTVDISGQPAGTSMEYKITTLNNKSLKLHGVGLHWD